MAKIAACLIVKNAADQIGACLDSIRPHVDEINVYDTGSTDGTVALLEKLNETTTVTVEVASLCDRCLGTGQNNGGDCPNCNATGRLPFEAPLAPIRVKQGEWRDDFAWAREQSFAMVSDDVDWLLWLDDDDTIEGAQWLRQLAGTAHPDLDGFIFFYDYARDDAGNCVCQLWRERLMRRDAGYTWLNPVHEVLIPPGRPARLANVPPEHVRYIHNRPPDRYPADRNLTILRRQHQEALAAGETPNPRLLAYLGTELMARSEWAEAATFLEQYVRHPDAGWNDERAQCHHKLAGCLRMLGNPLAAVEVEMQALRERDDWAETAVGLAQSFGALGQWDRAERWARRALELGIPQTPLIVNPLEFVLIPWLTIAEACSHMGRSDDALAAMQRALAAAPSNEFVQARLGELQALVQENEVVGAVMLLREVLVRHDENLKAHQLLENIPYVIAHRPEIVKARADQREMVAHYLRPEEYERWYRDEPKESTVDDEIVPTVGEYIPRAKRLLEGLAEQEAELGRKPTLLDLGCNDAWMACYLHVNAGVVADGIELNRQSVEKGKRRLKTFAAPGKLIHGNIHQAKRLVVGRRYDAVSLFEVLEHVPDVDALLDVMESVLKPGGRIYISTPNGAYERGQIDGWAHVERKGHLRAIPVSDLSETLAARGEIRTVELQHDSRVTFAAYTPRKRKGKIVFYAGGSWEPWSPRSIHEGGLGGSETALVQVSSRLAQAGYEVKVYSGAEPGLYVGAVWRPHTAFDPAEQCDLLIVSRLPHVFDEQLGATRTALWCHDHSYPGQLTEERAARIDTVVVLSDWQRDRFARLYPFLDGKLAVIRNGVTLHGVGDIADDRYPDAARSFADREPRCVYSSSGDRGLDLLLGLWPRVRERLPDAELHVFYGWEVFDRVAIGNPSLAAYKQRVLALVGQCGGEAGGVFMRGRIGQRGLADEMMQARVWAYPTAFLETSCIGAMEARASGLAIVTSDLGALRETVGTHGQLIPWGEDEDTPENQTGDYQDAFVEAVVDRLTNPAVWKRAHARARADVGLLDWSWRVPEWETLLPAVVKKTGRKPARAAA